MNPMDAQRYHLSKRGSPAFGENDVSDDGSARSGILPVVQEASSIETPNSPLLPEALTALKPHPSLRTQQCDAWAVPLPLSPLLSSKHPSLNGLVEETVPIPDKDSLTKFPVTSEDDPKSCQIPERHLPFLAAPSPKISHTSARPIRPLFLQDDGSRRIFSCPSSPSAISPPLSPWSGPMSPHFWKSSCPVPSYHGFDSLVSDRCGPMSCPTSPVLRPSNPLPSPTSPSPCHAMLSNVNRRLRALGSTSSITHEISPDPPRPMSPSWPTSPVLQVFNIDNWIHDRDPTEGIDTIEIMVTTEISVRIEETV